MSGRVFRVCVLAAAAFAAGGAQAAVPADEVLRIVRDANPTGSYLAGRFASASRDSASAAAFLRSALRADPRNPVLLDGAFRSFLAAGDLEAGMELAERIGQADPANRIATLALSVRAIRNRQFVSARSMLRSAVEGEQPDVAATLVTAWSWYGQGNPDEAIKALDRLAGNQLSEYLRDLHSGLIADAVDMGEEAVARLGAAQALDAGNFFVNDAYARRLIRSGRLDEARAALQAMQQTFANDPRVTELMEDLEAGRVPDAVVSTARRGAAEAMFGFGRLANRTESAEIARIYLNLALYLEPQHELAVLALADLAENLQAPAHAIAAYRRLSPRSLFAREAQIRIAINLARQEKMAEATQQLETLIYRDPDDLSTYLALGNLLHSDKKYEEAAKVYTRALSTLRTPEGQHWSLFFSRAVSSDAAKNWPQAQADLKKALELAPEHPTLLNYLGYSWVDRGMNLAAGIDMIRRAVDARPNDGDIIDSLGWSYYRLGKYKDAVTELERAIEIKPQSWEINDHLGDAYWKVGRKLEAHYQWAHALEIVEEAETKALITRKINEGLEPVERELEAKRAAERAAMEKEQTASAAAAGGAAGRPRPAAGGETYTIQSGDSLWTIAQKLYGDGNRYNDIVRANETLDPARLAPGQQIVIPRP